MPIPSVQRIAPAVLVLVFFLFPSFAQAQLQGKWECTTKSGNYDANTHYNVRCGGFLNFKADRVLESTCVDGFFPSGTYWEAFGNRLTLRDSAGKAFADFEIREISNEKLLLVRKDVHFAFRRVESVVSTERGRN